MTALINSTRCRARIFLFCLDTFFYSFNFQVIKKIIALERRLYRGPSASGTNLLLLQVKPTSFTQVSQGTLIAVPNCCTALSGYRRAGEFDRADWTPRRALPLSFPLLGFCKHTNWEHILHHLTSACISTAGGEAYRQPKGNQGCSLSESIQYNIQKMYYTTS